MEYILLAIVIVQSIVITKLVVRPTKPLTEEDLVKLKREKIEKEWEKLFNYNETIAAKGYKDE